jgi:hypothetical protein
MFGREQFKPRHQFVGKQNNALACIALVMLGGECFKLDQKLVSKLCSFYRRFQAAKWKPHRAFPLPARRCLIRAAQLKCSRAVRYNMREPCQHNAASRRPWKATKRDADHGSPCPVLTICPRLKKGGLR